MYITVTNTKRKVGFKGLEVNDVIIGLPLLFILLFMFSFDALRIPALILLVITIFLFLPVNLSKKNRMYKVMYLATSYLLKNKTYIYFKEEKKEGKINDLIKRIQN